jgi:hypothetical protein
VDLYRAGFTPHRYQGRLPRWGQAVDTRLGGAFCLRHSLDAPSWRTSCVYATLPCKSALDGIVDSILIPCHCCDTVTGGEAWQTCSLPVRAPQNPEVRLELDSLGQNGGVCANT